MPGHALTLVTKDIAWREATMSLSSRLVADVSAPNVAEPDRSCVALQPSSEGRGRPRLLLGEDQVVEALPREATRIGGSRGARRSS